MNEADTTKAAVIAMRKASMSRKARSGDISNVAPAKAGADNHGCPCGAKGVGQPFENEGTRRMGPGLRRDDARISHPFHRHRHLRAVLDGLVDHAIAFGELEQQVELVLRRRALDL